MPNASGISDHNGEKAVTLAEGYKSINRRQALPRLYSMLDAARDEGKRLAILDIGSGSGNDAIEAVQLGHHVVGVEPSDLRDIAIRDHSHEKIDYRAGKLPELDTIKQDEKFDLVVMSATWQYIDPAERVASLQRIANILKPGGEIFLIYPSPPSRTHQFEVSPEMLDADIRAANALLPKGKKIAIQGEPSVMPDTRGRKSLDGRELNFYTYVLQAGHAQAIGSRDGWTKTVA